MWSDVDRASGVWSVLRMRALFLANVDIKMIAMQMPKIYGPASSSLGPAQPV